MSKRKVTFPKSKNMYLNGKLASGASLSENYFNPYFQNDPVEFVTVDLDSLVKNKMARQIQVRMQFQGSIHQVTLTRNR